MLLYMHGITVCAESSNMQLLFLRIMPIQGNALKKQLVISHKTSKHCFIFEGRSHGWSCLEKEIQNYHYSAIYMVVCTQIMQAM